MFSCDDYSWCYWFVGLLLSGWRRTGRRITCSLVMIIPGIIWFVGLLLSGWRRAGRRITCSLVMIIPGIIGFINIPCTLYGKQNELDCYKKINITYCKSLIFRGYYILWFSP